MHAEVFRTCAVFTQLAINDGDNFFLVVITIVIPIVEEMIGEVHLVVRTTMKKMMIRVRRS